jgi:hypothetical protein
MGERSECCTSCWRQELCLPVKQTCLQTQDTKLAGTRIFLQVIFKELISVRAGAKAELLLSKAAARSTPFGGLARTNVWTQGRCGMGDKMSSSQLMTPHGHFYLDKI